MRWRLRTRNDLTVMVLGEGSIMNAEAASRASLDFVGQQEQLLEAVVATGKPVVLVLINARPINLTWASEHVPAILEAWMPGQEGGNAVADLLFGDAVPGGKLPITWPRNGGQIPIYYAHNLTQAAGDGSEVHIALLGSADVTSVSVWLWSELYDVFVQQRKSEQRESEDRRKL